MKTKVIEIVVCNRVLSVFKAQGTPITLIDTIVTDEENSHVSLSMETCKLENISELYTNKQKMIDNLIGKLPKKLNARGKEAIVNALYNRTTKDLFEGIYKNVS